MNSTWTTRGVVTLALFVGISLVAGPTQQWSSQILAAPAADQAKSQTPMISVIDITYIFKNHKVFVARMKALERKTQLNQENMKIKEAKLQAMKERLEKVTDKTENKVLEGELAQQAMEHQLSTRRLQSELSEEEARAYYETYSLLQEETTKYCRARGIVITLKFDRESIKPDDRKSVIAGLGRHIVFSDAPDITDDILKAMDSAAETREAKAEKVKSR